VDGSKRLVPALGEQWAHGITNRVMLYWTGEASEQGQRMASLLKSPSMPSRTVSFAVTSKGFRDMPPQTASTTSQPSQQVHLHAVTMVWSESETHPKHIRSRRHVRAVSAWVLDPFQTATTTKILPCYALCT
jgi:hypothetical protein